MDLTTFASARYQIRIQDGDGEDSLSQLHVHKTGAQPISIRPSAKSPHNASKKVISLVNLPLADMCNDRAYCRGAWDESQNWPLRQLVRSLSDLSTLVLATLRKG